MNKLDKLLKEALDNQRKIDETVKFLKENEEHLTEEQEDKLDEIKYKMEEELLPEIKKLEKNNIMENKYHEDNWLNQHLNRVGLLDKKLSLSDINERDTKILYWAKQLEHKSLSLHELVENAKWLLDNVRFEK